MRDLDATVPAIDLDLIGIAAHPVDLKVGDFDAPAVQLLIVGGRNDVQDVPAIGESQLEREKVRTGAEIAIRIRNRGGRDQGERNQTEDSHWMGASSYNPTKQWQQAAATPKRQQSMLPISHERLRSQ